MLIIAYAAFFMWGYFKAYINCKCYLCAVVVTIKTNGDLCNNIVTFEANIYFVRLKYGYI